MVELELVLPAAQRAWTVLVAERVRWHAELRQGRGPIDKRMDVGGFHEGCAHCVRRSAALQPSDHPAFEPPGSLDRRRQRRDVPVVRGHANRLGYLKSLPCVARGTG